MKMVKNSKSFIAFLLLTTLPMTSFAWGTDNQITTALQNLLEFVTGDVAKFISMLCLVAVGYLTISRGVIPKEKGVATCIGIAIIFATQSLYSMFSGQ